MKLFNRRKKPSEWRKSRDGTAMELVACTYRDPQHNEFTQVTATCACGRGGWLRLPLHPIVYKLEETK